MKYNYYRHLSRGFYDDYFGRIGKPVKTNIFLYYFLKLFRYRVTKVLNGSKIDVVLTQSLLNSGTHLKSWNAEKLFEEYGELNV